MIGAPPSSPRCPVKKEVVELSSDDWQLQANRSRWEDDLAREREAMEQSKDELTKREAKLAQRTVELAQTEREMVVREQEVAMERTRRRASANFALSSRRKI